MKKQSSSNRKLSSIEQSELLKVLKARFEKHMERHAGVEWKKVEARLAAEPEKLRTLNEMDKTGGEPDITEYNKKTDEFTFCDCAAESPKRRRSVCYDREGLESRKEFKPEGNAVDMAAAMGIEILTEEQYRALQKIVKVDLKTSSWVQTPADVRKLGGALFMDNRYGRVFVYHNGASSYYAVRGFRGMLKV